VKPRGLNKDEAIRLFGNPEPLLPWQEHSQPSIDAAHSLKPHAYNLREKVYNAIKSHGLSGLTSQQIEIVTELSGNTVRPRIVELANAGRIMEAGTRPTKSGRQAAVWVVNHGQ
jgi:hypothetical protein